MATYAPRRFCLTLTALAAAVSLTAACGGSDSSQTLPQDAGATEDVGTAPVDTGLADTGNDAGVAPVDAGPADAGSDASVAPVDAGPADTGNDASAAPVDAGLADTGNAVDAGPPVDAGNDVGAVPVDAGPADAGSTMDVPTDTGPTCLTGQTLCGGVCVNLLGDSNHCGACGAGCPSGQSCTSGVCVPVCGAGLSLCSGMCRDLQRDATHCGACGNACGSNEACRGGVCVYNVPASCRLAQVANPQIASGEVTIDPDGAGGGAPFPVYCDMASDGGGWTLIGRIGEALPGAQRGEFRSDRNLSLLTNGNAPTSQEFSTLDLARFAAYASRWQVRVMVDTANNGSHFQSTFYRPQEGSTTSLTDAGSNWLGTTTGASLEYLTRSSNIGAANSRYLPVQGIDVAGFSVALFTYRRASNTAACLDINGENQLCHAPAGGVYNTPSLAGTFTAAFSNNDGVSHAWGRRATYWVRDSRCSPTHLDCDGNAGNGCETPIRDSAAHCGACGRACASGQVCIAGACRAPFPRSCQALRVADTTATSGLHTVDPDGQGGVDPFQVYCDMSLDGGGWTLLGAGSWYDAEANLVSGPGGSNALLSEARRNAVMAASTNLYRFGSTSTARLFVEDTAPEFGPASTGAGRHYWRSRAMSQRCTTSYTDVVQGAMRAVPPNRVSCDPLGIGNHTCGVGSGWILWHVSDTYNLSGAHPCAFGTGAAPTGSALRDLWVR